MSRMAAYADLGRLSWMLEVVKIEAQRIAKPTPPGRQPRKPRGKRPDRPASGG